MHVRKQPPFIAAKPVFIVNSNLPAFIRRITWRIQAIGNYILGAYVGRKLVGSQHKLLDELEMHAIENLHIQAQETTILTYDHARLHGRQFKYTGIKNKSDVTILYFPGANNLYQETQHDIAKMAHKNRCSVVTFNYRSTGWSQGKITSQQDLIVDAIAQVDRLLHEGVPSEKIILYGPSLGGAVAIQAAKYFLERNLPVYLHHKSSFSSLSDVVLARIATLGRTGHYIYPAGRLLSLIATPFVKGIIWFTNWDLDIKNAVQTIPSEYINTVVVRSPRDRRQRYKSFLLDDADIPYESSSYYLLKKLNIQQNAGCKFQAKSIQENGHEYGVVLERVTDGKSYQACFSDFFQFVSDKGSTGKAQYHASLMI